MEVQVKTIEERERAKRDELLKKIERGRLLVTETICRHRSAYGEETVRHAAHTQLLTDPIVLRYKRRQGVPYPTNTHLHQGIESYALWAWGDTRILANGMLIQIEEHVIGGVPTRLCLRLRPDDPNHPALSLGRLQLLVDCLDELEYNCYQQALRGHQRQN